MPDTVSKWIEGAPPETFKGLDEVLIVAQIPSRFLSHGYSFKAFRWRKGSWGYTSETPHQELSRASRYMMVPLPPD